MRLSGRQSRPAIDTAVYRPNETLYQLQPSFYTHSTEPEPTARARRADGSARACGVGDCPCLVPILGDPGEASGPRTDGFHRLDYLRTPGATGARGREDLQGSRRRRACGGTYSRRRSPAILDHDARRIYQWRDHGLGSSNTANEKNTVFTPKFSPYRSLWTMNGPNGPQTRSRMLRCPRTLVKIAD